MRPRRPPSAMRTVITALACVCALLSEGRAGVTPSTFSLPDAPDYVGYLELLTKEGKILSEHLPHGRLEITDPRRHYVVIIGVLGAVVEHLSSDYSVLDYDKHFLPAVDRLLPLMWQYPDEAVDKIETFILNINETVQKIQDIKNYYCKKTTPKVCNIVIEDLTYNRTDHKQAREVLTAAGELAAVYHNNPYVNEAKSYDEVALLLRGKEKFRPLVYQAVKVYKLLYGKASYEKRQNPNST